LLQRTLAGWFHGKAVHPHTASVSGRVTIGNGPAVGIQVALPRSGNSPEGENKIYRAKTDQENRLERSIF